MPPTEVSATEAARRLGDLLARVRYRGESFLIRRGRTIVAQLAPPPWAGRPAREVAESWSRRSRLGADEARAFARDVDAGRRRLNQPPKSPWPR